ncbi:ABC transporter permease [Parabacteroides sp. ASD2025]|uniref:ABC transporter permease n=1 Tax=Parabacteroides sp. ASD2025 TaxID=3415987 RepID=UPI003CFB3FCF
MYKQYLRQAWQLMKQNRFFSTVYIIGTGLAISMVMVMAVVYHIRTADIAPEVNRDRMCYVTSVSFKMNDNKGSLNSGNGPRFVKEVIYNLKTPEAVAITTMSQIMPFLVGDIFMQIPGHDEAPKVSLMGCNDQFWKVYSFTFEEGKPFTDADFQSGMPRAVLAESLARRLFGRTDVTGQAVLINDVEYTVSGVVADVSGITSDVYADVWIPYTSMAVIMKNMSDEKEGSAGLLLSNILLRDAGDLEAFKAELAREVKRYNTTLTEGQITVGDPVSYADRMVSNLLQMDVKTTYIALAIVLVLFLLVPALNLSGLNASHMQDRIPEIGVRKAFGAPRGTLLSQIFVENMLLMLPGGVAGLLFSYVLVFLFRNILLSSGIFAMLMGTGGAIFLSPGMLLNMEVFFYAFLVCLVLNLLSSMVPAWRAVKVNITDALNG